MNGLITAFTAVVLAGDRGSGDPVAEAAGVCCKSLTPVGGTPMVLRVLDALTAAAEIDTIVLCGPRQSAVDQDEELRNRIRSGKVRWVEQQATPSSSTYQTLELLPTSTPVLVTTADHALLTAEMVDYFCSQARSTGGEIVVGLASDELVRRAYPETKRTTLRLRDGAYCSCNLFAFLSPRARAMADFWRKVEAQRKKTLRVISVFGWMAVLLYVLRQVSLDEGLKRISRRMGLKAGAVVMPFPEAAVDVDTAEDWKLVESIVAGRTS